jgi:hypothetical protein
MPRGNDHDGGEAQALPPVAVPDDVARAFASAPAVLEEPALGRVISLRQVAGSSEMTGALAEALAALDRASFGEQFAISPDRWAHNVADPNAELFVLASPDGRRLSGFVRVKYEGPEGGVIGASPVEISLVAAVPQGQGRGPVIMDAVLRELADRGWTIATLESRPTSVGFYDRYVEPRGIRRPTPPEADLMFELDLTQLPSAEELRRIRAAEASQRGRAPMAAAPRDEPIPVWSAVGDELNGQERVARLSRRSFLSALAGTVVGGWLALAPQRPAASQSSPADPRDLNRRLSVDDAFITALHKVASFGNSLDVYRSAIRNTDPEARALAADMIRTLHTDARLALFRPLYRYFDRLVLVDLGISGGFFVPVTVNGQRLRVAVIDVGFVQGIATGQIQPYPSDVPPELERMNRFLDTLLHEGTHAFNYTRGRNSDGSHDRAGDERDGYTTSWRLGRALGRAPRDWSRFKWVADALQSRNRRNPAFLTFAAQPGGPFVEDVGLPLIQAFEAMERALPAGAAAPEYVSHRFRASPGSARAGVFEIQFMARTPQGLRAFTVDVGVQVTPGRDPERLGARVDPDRAAEPARLRRPAGRPD